MGHVLGEPKGSPRCCVSLSLTTAPQHEEEYCNGHQHGASQLEKGAETCMPPVVLWVHAWFTADDAEADQEAIDAYQERNRGVDESSHCFHLLISRRLFR